VQSLHNDVAHQRVSAGGALGRLFELTVRLSELMDRGLAQRGLTRARATLIWQLHHQGEQTQRELSQALRVTPRNITGLVDALEASGLAARRPHPSDRRATLVGLTDEGRRLAAALEAEHQQFAGLLFADVAKPDLAGFIGVADALLERLRDSTSLIR
jgi:DNA-binding MarR family transcriptional regulator